MRDSYSLYEAKAKLSAIIRQVREGRRIVVTLHGEPVAEIRPIPPDDGGIAGRIATLLDSGMVIPAANPQRRFRAGPRKAGALARFLRDRE